ncbi:MAG: copper transporter [Cellulomonadaceae bacterium]|nr:copper transporter [Cellulomonadaceae bacterium]
MVDFRYHLVSLISVFLALAIGIILGAGPLQGTLGNQLTEQVESLRTERNEARSQLSDAQAAAAPQLGFIDGVGDQIIADTLTGRRVAVISLAHVSADNRSAVIGRLETAGASIDTRLTVTSLWTDDGSASLRDSTAAGLRDQLTSLVDADAGTNYILAAALTTVLAGQGDAGAIAHTLLDAGLITVDGALGEGAEAVVFLADLTADTTPATETASDTDDDDADADAGAATASPSPDAEATPSHSNDSLVAIIEKTVTVLPTVIAGSTPVSGDLFSDVLGTAPITTVASTVAGVDTMMGQVIVPLAVAELLTGAAPEGSATPGGRYGIDGSTVTMPSLAALRAAPAADGVGGGDDAVEDGTAGAENGDNH